MKKALITGITGQDGSYLTELLLQKEYIVHGLIRRTSTNTTSRISHLLQNSNLILHHGDLTDGNFIIKLVRDIKPDEIYNLGAQSDVGISFKNPVYTTQVNVLGNLHILEAILESKQPIKMYQASTSEMFGNTTQTPQNEQTPFSPQSPYGISKVTAHMQTINYRQTYGIYACNGILFNHESERRGENFVTRKITLAATRIKLGLQNKLYLGNLEAKRDWGHAKDYVKAMWIMLQQEKSDDYIIATGKTYTVKEFVQEAFTILDLDWEKYTELDTKYLRPAEVNILQGDYTKAKTNLGWQPTINFKELVKIMIEHDRGNHVL